MHIKPLRPGWHKGTATFPLSDYQLLTTGTKDMKPPTSANPPSWARRTLRAPVVRQIIVAVIAFAMGACADTIEPTFRSMSISRNGQVIAFLERRDPEFAIHIYDAAGNSRVVRDLPTPQPLEISLTPDGKNLLFVTRSLDARRESNEWTLWRMNTLDGGDLHALSTSPIFLASPRETSNGEVVFLRGTQTLGNKRLIAQWTTLREGNANSALSSKDYGYRMNPTVLEGKGLVMLNLDGIGSSASEVVDFVPLDESIERPRLPGDDVSKKTVGFGCDSGGIVCYRLENVDAPGRPFFHHRLSLHWKGMRCDVKIGHDWIDAVSLSSDGNHVAFVGTTFNDKRTIVDRNLVVLQVSSTACATVSVIRKLHREK